MVFICLNFTKVQQPGAAQAAVPTSLAAPTAATHQVISGHPHAQVVSHQLAATGPAIQQIIQQPAAIYPQQSQPQTQQQPQPQQKQPPVVNITPAAPLRQKSKDEPPRKIARVQPTPHVVRPIPTKAKVSPALAVSPQQPPQPRLLPPTAVFPPPQRSIAPQLPSRSSPSVIVKHKHQHQESHLNYMETYFYDHSQLNSSLSYQLYPSICKRYFAC